MVFHSPSPASDTFHLLGRAEAWFDVEPALPLRLGARPWALVLLDDARCASKVSHFLACSDGDADPAVERIGPIESAFTRDIWVLTLRELRSTPRVRAFMDHVEECLRSKPRQKAKAKVTGPRGAKLGKAF
jgi:DNA-binding transcriptional LysR family regulator